MRTDTTVWITEPDVRIEGQVLEALGSPFARLAIAGPGAPALIIAMGSEMDPAAQRAFFQRLGREAYMLAASIPVGDEPDAEVRTVLGAVGA